MADSVLAYVRNFGGEFFLAALGVTHFQLEFLNVDGGENILAHHFLRNHDGILEVVSLPGHEGHHHVAAQSEFAAFGTVTLTQGLAFLDLLAFQDHRLQVQAGVLVGASEFHETVAHRVVVETHVAILLGALVADDNLGSVHVVDHAIAFGHDQRPRVHRHALFESGTHDWGLRTQQRHGLALHIRSHQGAVSVVVFQERNQRRGHRNDLVGGNVHKRRLRGIHHREVALKARLDFIHHKVSFLVHLAVGLGDILRILFLGGHVGNILRQLAVGVDFSVGCFDEAHAVDFGKHAKR